MPRWGRIGVLLGWIAFGLALVVLVAVGLLMWQQERDKEAACEGLPDGAVVATASDSDVVCDGDGA
jgi:hypothetical protein